MNARGKTLWMGMLIIAFLMSFSIVSAETIFKETMGAAPNIMIVSSYTGWSNYGSFTYSGTANARDTYNSAGEYPGASGAGNIYFVGGIGDYFQISGINTRGFSNIKLGLSLYKANSSSSTGNAENGSNFLIQYSVDSGQSWRRMPITIPTGSNTTGNYYWRELSENLPATDNLSLSFTNIGSTEPVHFRMDDVTLSGTTDGFFHESLGEGAANTAIGSFTGWTSNSLGTFSGTGFVRNDLPSTGAYSGASGGGNILLDAGQYFQLSGLNITAYNMIALSVGIMKSASGDTGAKLMMSYSIDGLSWSSPQPCFTNGVSANLWYMKSFTIAPGIYSNVCVRFSNASTTGGLYRIDDIRLRTAWNTPEIGFPTSTLITLDGATLGARIVNLNCSAVSQRGFYYSTQNGFADGAGTPVYESVAMNQAGEYSLPVSGLQANTVYYYKAFATNSSGTSYSGQASFTTLAVSNSSLFTIDNTLPTAGTNFQSYGEALNYLNANFAGSSTGFTFLLKDGQVFNEDNSLNSRVNTVGTAAKQVLFQRDYSGTIRPKLSRDTSNEPVVCLFGSDWVTFDGIDVQMADQYGFELTSFNTGSNGGAQHITIKNCTITGRYNAAYAGIYHSYRSTPTTEAGKHSYNKFQNITITGVKRGIFLNGVATDIEISGCTITGIGAEYYCEGIRVSDVANLVIANNVVHDLWSGTQFPTGIEVENCTGNVEICNNKISHLKGTWDSAFTTVLGSGIKVERSSTFSDIKIYNNMIWNLLALNPEGDARIMIRGIYVVPGSTVGNLSIDFNTIRLSSTTGSSIGMKLVNPRINLRNNVIQLDCASANRQYWGIEYDDFSGSSGTIDHNVIYLSDPSRGAHLMVSNVPYTLESWQSTSGLETASWIYNPKLTSATDLHVIPGADTPVESNGSYFNGAISWVTEDIDGEPRNGSTPDIGADEGAFTFTAPQIPSNPLSLTATSINAEEFTLAATANASGNAILVAYNTTNTFGIPGGIYSAGAAITGGGTVIHSGSAQDLGFVPGFSPGTTYYFKAWSYATTERTTYYTYSSGIISTGTTPARINLPSVITVNPSGSGTFNYDSLSQALHDVKIGIIPNGGLTIKVRADYSETISAPLIIDITSSSTKPITIQKDPATAGDNPRFTRVDSGSIYPTVAGGYGDSVIRIEGSDYLSIDGIDAYALDSGIEYGYLIHKPNANNGSQYLNIRNCVISMNKGTSPYVTGIYIGNGTTDPASKDGWTVTNTSGMNKYVTVSGTLINNVHTGIHAQGSAAIGFWDANICIGQTGSLNQIINFGGGTDSDCYGVVFYNVTNPTVTASSIDNSMSPALGYLCGIYIRGLYSKEPSEPYNHLNMVAGAVIVSDNYIKLANTSVNQWTYWINNYYTSTSETITNNNLAAGVMSSNGAAYLIDAGNQSITKTTTGNATSGTISLTGATASFSCYSNTVANTFGHTWAITELVSNNNFSNIVATGVANISGLNASDLSNGTKTLSGNTLSNWSTEGEFSGINAANNQNVQINNNLISEITASFTWYGISVRGLTADITANCYNNVIRNLTTSGAGTLTGIEQGNRVATGNCYNNFINSLSATHPDATVVGLLMTSSSTLTSIYNNMIYGLSAVGADAVSGTPTVTGIMYGGEGVGNIYYNTVFLNGSSTGAGYSSAALFHAMTDYQATTGANARIRNNIFVNNSAPGSLGKSVALWKTISGSTGMGSSSNKNIYYAGLPDANHLIAYLGTTPYPTLLEYKSVVATVDQASFTENVPFVSSSGNIDVHINATIPTYVQNQGGAISGFTKDIDGQTRHSSTPDIGADEGNFTIAPTCVAPTAQPTNLILVPNHNSISIQFTPSAAQEYLVIRHTSATPSVSPVNGTSYLMGQTLGNATVVSADNANLSLASGLNAATQYYISVYAYNSYGLSAPKYLTTSPLRMAVTTLSSSHNQPSAFTASAVNPSTIALSVSPNIAGDHIIVAYSYHPLFGTPLGNHSVGSTINGGGTILYMGPASGLSSHTGLYPWSRVYYKAWSYYSINRTAYYSYSDGVVADAKTLIDPLAGVKTVNPNIFGANNFISISEAVSALNYAGVGTGGITLNIVAGCIDSLTAPLVFSTPGSISSPIVIQKDPATPGANPLLYRNDEGSFATSVIGGDGDSIIRIEGCDYLTFDGIDVRSLNSAIEYGYFATKPSETNGCQNLSIKNCNVTMTKVTGWTTNFVAGFYISNGPTSLDSSTGVTVTAPSGQNSFVTISGNTIRNTNYGILLIGSSAPGYPDTDFTIGAEGTGNNIEDYSGVDVCGIKVQYINNPAICHNSLNNAAGGGASNATNLSGIDLGNVTGDISVNYNSINLLVNSSYGSGSMYWIHNTGTGSQESYIGNTFGTGEYFNNYSYSYFISLNNHTPIRIVSDNSTLGIGQHTTFSYLYGYYSYSNSVSGTETVTNNSFSNLYGSSACGIYMASNRNGARICSGNTISGWSGQSIVGIYLSTSSTAPSVISNNTISNLTATYNVAKGIEVGTAVSEISGNVIDNLNGEVSRLYGISQSYGSSTCYNNLISNLNGTGSNTLVRGLRFDCSSQIYNNIIHSLSALGSDNTPYLPDLAAIETAAFDYGTPFKLYYNSVLLNSSGTGTAFTSAGLKLGPGIHDLRNNSIVNKCTTGSNGRTIAVWKGDNYSNIAPSSNNNIYHAGTITTGSSFGNMIGYMNNVVKASLSSYQAGVSPAEQNSYTEDVPYASTTGTIDLHINPNLATYAESRAVPIVGYLTDFDGQTRNTISPDIGADEGDFTPFNLPPLPATEPSPADLANEQLTDIQLSWSRSSGGGTPTSYNVYFGTSNPPALIGNQATTSYDPETLVYGQTYYWMIDPANLYGVASALNTLPLWSFSTHNPLPEAAILVSPANEATDITINPILSWSAGSGSAPTGYKLYLGTDNPPTNVIDGTDLGDVSSYAPGSASQSNPIGNNNSIGMISASLSRLDLDAILSRNSLNYNTTYYWKVIPYTLAGDADSIAVWSFTTELAPVPSVAINPLPVCLATDQSITPLLSWEANTEGTEPDSYNVYFGTSNPPVLIGDQDTASYNPGILAYGSTYYWMIDPHSSRGYSSQDNTLPVWSFTTRNPLPEAAILVSPANEATLIPIDTQLSWSPNPEGVVPTGYNIYFGSTNPPELIGNFASTSYDPGELSPGTTYYWQVDPQSSDGYCSEENSLPLWSFSTEDYPFPTQAVLVSPGDGSSGSNSAISLNWAAGAGATPTGYRIYFGTNYPPTNILNGLDLGAATTCNPADLLYSTTYYWQVLAYNSLGDAPPATIWSFSIAAPSVSIGTGTGTNRSPFGTYYGYERDATLYLASEIGSLPQPIRSLAWYATRNVSTSTPFKVYLKATTATTLPSLNWASTISDASLVFNGSFASITANSWMNINLNSAFTIPIGSNLMVMIETNYGGSGNGNMSGGGFRNTNYSPVNTLHKYWMSNNSPPTTSGSYDILRANIRLSSSSTGTAAPNPALATAPLSGASGVSITTTLNWISGGGNATGYRLYLGTDGDGITTPTNMVLGLDIGTACSYTLTDPLAYDTTYYWKVLAYNSYGAASGTNVWSFTTKSEPVLSLDAPSSLTIELLGWMLFLRWDAVPGAESYLVFRSEDPSPADWGLPIAVTDIPSYMEPAFDSRCFYRVVASSSDRTKTIPATITKPQPPYFKPVN